MNYQERLFRQRHGYQCEPGTLSTIAYYAALAIAAVGTTSSIQGQRYAAQAQEEQQFELTKANNSVAARQMSQLRIQEAQQREAATRENEKARLATQKAQASATVSAGEAGVSGLSVDALLGEYSAQLGQFRDASNRQSQLNSQGINSQIEAVREGAKYGNLQINAPITGPNIAAEVVKFGGQALGSYRDYNPSAFQKKSKGS